MSGLILPSTYARRTIIDRGDDVNDITRSVQDGDMLVGWRGDSSMDVYREGSMVKVMGFDRAGSRYVAATVNLVNSDWRRTLIEKLRDGDWQNDNFTTKLANERAQAEKNRADREADEAAEIADRLTTAVWRDKGSRRHF